MAEPYSCQHLLKFLQVNEVTRVSTDLPLSRTGQVVWERIPQLRKYCRQVWGQWRWVTSTSGIRLRHKRSAVPKHRIWRYKCWFGYISGSGTSATTAPSVTTQYSSANPSNLGLSAKGVMAASKFRPKNWYRALMPRRPHRVGLRWPVRIPTVHWHQNWVLQAKWKLTLIPVKISSKYFSSEHKHRVGLNEDEWHSDLPGNEHSPYYVNSLTVAKEGSAKRWM